MFDPKEPERPEGDPKVFAFLKSLHPADFTIREDGVVRLNPELARRVAWLVIRVVRSSGYGPVAALSKRSNSLSIASTPNKIPATLGVVRTPWLGEPR